MFYPEPLPVPAGLDAPEFVLRPLTPAHAALDYAALMASREMLRLWSGSPWPADDFTLADNEADLRWHWDEHQHRIAFTYTVLNPAQDACLGCVYIKPNPYVAVSPAALVRFWVTAPYLESRLDDRLLAALLPWFRDEWAFAHANFHARRANAPQIALFLRLGLPHTQTVTLPDRGGEHWLFTADSYTD